MSALSDKLQMEKLNCFIKVIEIILQGKEQRGEKEKQT